MATHKTPHPRQYRTGVFWLSWLLLTGGLCGYFYYAVNSLQGHQSSLATIFLPGKTSDGHHQIETACTTCHTEAFGGKELIQDACMSCHATELKKIDDSHPKKKFTDPRNADTLSRLDARYCVTCHVEHRPEITQAMGVTQPTNLCFHCHAEVAKDRPTHKDLEFNTCATGGCHNFHDNKALYEDFLLKHVDKPANLRKQTVSERDLMSFFQMTSQYPTQQYPLEPLTLPQADAPQTFRVDTGIQDDWLTTRHAEAGVNCSACHEVQNKETQILGWVAKPDHTSCQACHQDETGSFLQGKHGMRLAAGLSPMTPSQARLPMRPDSHDTQVNCISCHSAHRFDTRKAAVESCLQCHNDDHSNNFRDSPHAKLWANETSGKAPAGSGVSCATCHMPRIDFENEEEIGRTLVDHNQNNTLRPNEKMLRPVCMQCHGAGFALDALADTALIKQNFKGQPDAHVKSMDMVREAERLHQEKKNQEKKNQGDENP